MLRFLNIKRSILDLLLLLFTLTLTARQNLSVAISAVLQTVSGNELFSSHTILFLLNTMGLCDYRSNSNWYMYRSVDRRMDRGVDGFCNRRSHSGRSMHWNMDSLCDAWLDYRESMSVTVV